MSEFSPGGFKSLGTKRPEKDGRTARTDTRRCRRSNINLCLPSRWVCKGIPKAIFSRKAPVIGTMHSVFREADFVRPCQTGLQIPPRGGWGLHLFLFLFLSLSTGQTCPEGRSTNRTQVLCEVLHPTLSRKTREIDHNTGNYVPYSFR